MIALPGAGSLKVDLFKQRKFYYWAFLHEYITSCISFFLGDREDESEGGEDVPAVPISKT